MERRKYEWIRKERMKQGMKERIKERGEKIKEEQNDKKQEWLWKNHEEKFLASAMRSLVS